MESYEFDGRRVYLMSRPPPLSSPRRRRTATVPRSAPRALRCSAQVPWLRSWAGALFGTPKDFMVENIGWLVVYGTYMGNIWINI